MITNKKSFWIGFTVVVLLFVFTGSCIDNYISKKEFEKEVLEKEIKTFKDSIKESEKIRKIKSDSLQKEYDKKDKEILKLRSENSKLTNDIKEVKKKAENEKSKVKDFSFKQQAKWIELRYGLPVDFNDTSVVIYDKVPGKIIDELIDKDAYEITVFKQEKIIENKDKDILLLEQKFSDKQTELNDANKTISLFKEKEIKQDELNATNNSIIKTQKAKTVVGTIIGVGVGIIGGILIAK